MFECVLSLHATQQNAQQYLAGENSACHDETTVVSKQNRLFIMFDVLAVTVTMCPTGAHSF